MRKELFFEYCEKLFAVCFEIHKDIDYLSATYYNQRMPGFLAERLTGIFIAEKEPQYKTKKCQYLHIEKGIKVCLLPKFGKESIAVCLSSDDDSAPYLGVTVSSIKANRQPNTKYEIYVIDAGVTETNKKRVLLMAEEGFSIQFVNIQSYLEDIDTSIFTPNSHFSISSYGVFFISQIFKNFDKILYLNCNLIVNHDLAELYQLDMKEFALAAAPDIEMHRCLMVERTSKGELSDYLKNKLKMKHPESYFQSGVLLLDIKKLQKMNFTDICLKKLAEIRDPLYVDQCVLNAVFDADYLPLEMKWNVLWQLPYYIKHLNQQLSYEKYITYFAARKNPYIVHYAGKIKPWNNPKVDLAELWWKYARLSPFYEQIIYELITSNINARDVLTLGLNKIKYLKYKFCAAVMLGKKRKKYQQKKKDMENRLKK